MIIPQPVNSAADVERATGHKNQHNYSAIIKTGHYNLLLIINSLLFYFFTYICYTHYLVVVDEHQIQISKSNQSRSKTNGRGKLNLNLKFESEIILKIPNNF